MPCYIYICNGYMFKAFGYNFYFSSIFKNNTITDILYIKSIKKNEKNKAHILKNMINEKQN